MKSKIKFNTPLYMVVISILYFVAACSFCVTIRDDKLRENVLVMCQTWYVLLLTAGLVVRDFIIRRINRDRK